MKMKEVLKATGLTDRAVRLYIEKELVCPENEKSYTGRNNLNFSEKDVELLKKIATLRKAGFSISQIQSIQSDSEQAQLALNELLETKGKEQELNKKVIDALSPLRGRDGLNIDMISDSLENSVKNEKVPDIHYTQSSDEIAERVSFIIFAVIGLLPALFFFIIPIIYPISEFRFLKLQDGGVIELLIICIILLIPVALFIGVIVLHSKPRYNAELRWRRSVISVIMFIISFLMVLTSSPAGCLVMCMGTPFCSQTTDPSNYLQLDAYIVDYGQEGIYDLFPDYIPRSAVIEDKWGRFTGQYPDTTKYYYIYECVVDPSYDIVAQWQLPEEEYEKAKGEIFNKQDEIIGTETKGDWQLVHFTEDYTEEISSWSYYFVIFAYNDDTNTVRYIASYCQDVVDGIDQPYYYSLDW